jgi:peptidoglycan/LPS O-acetylase OafA/YrhL
MVSALTGRVGGVETSIRAERSMVDAFGGKLPQFILTCMLLAGFAGTVAAYLAVNMTDKNAEIIKTILAGMGQACLLALGYWFGQGGR